MRISGIALLLPLALAACGGPESQLTDALKEAGLPAKQAGCLAEGMADKLSIGQLLKLRSLKNFKKDELTDLSLKRFLHNVRALDDPEIVAVTSKAALNCAISG